MISLVVKVVGISQCILCMLLERNCQCQNMLDARMIKTDHDKPGGEGCGHQPMHVCIQHRKEGQDRQETQEGQEGPGEISNVDLD